MEEDGEWSDPSDVKSGSATGFSEDEDMKIEGIFHAKPLNRGGDPVNDILDRIDAELNSLSRSQSSSGTGSTVVRKTENSSKDRATNEDDASASLHSERSGSFRSSTDRDFLEAGLKLSNLGHTALPREMESQKIFGSAEIYSDAANTTDQFSEIDTPRKNDQPSDLDSVSAKQIDDKFNEILKRKKDLFARYPKRGGYLENLRVRMPSDTETIKTEDYEDNFRENMVYNSGNQSYHGRTKSASPMRKAFPTDEKKVYETSKQKGFSSMPPVYPKTNQSARSCQDKSSNHHSKSKPGSSFISDAESIKTEDFETRFHDILQKRSTVARTNNPTHNPTLSDSDKDDESDPLHIRVKHVLGVASLYKTENSPERERKRKYRRHPERSKSEPLKMIPTHTPMSFSKADSDGVRSDKAKEVVSDDNGPEKKRRPEDTDSVIEERNEIARVSKKIQKEMHQERRARSKSPARREARSPTRVVIDLTASQKGKERADENSQRGLQFPENRVEFKSEERPKLYSSEFPTARVLEDTEHQLKEARSQLEDARSQIMLSDFKRDNTLKDLQQVTEELDRSKKQIRHYDEQIGTKLDELHIFDSLGLSQEEVKSYMRENESLKSRLRNVDAIELERDELVHQLEVAKEDLFGEQKHSRSRIEELQEELENVAHLLEEHQTGKNDLSQSLMNTEETFRQMEREKDSIIQEKTRLCEELKEKLKWDRSDSRKRSAKAVDELHCEMTEFSKKMSELQGDLSSEEDKNIQLRDQLMMAHHHLSQEEKIREAITAEHKKTLQSLRKETDNAMVKMRESLFLEKQREVESLRKEMEQERRSSSSKSEELATQHKAEYAHQLMAKTDDIQKLQHLIKRLDEDKRKREAELEQEAREQVKEALQVERQTLEAKYQWMIKQECDKNEKNRNKLKEVANSFEEENRLKNGLIEQLQQARVELEEAKLQNKHISHEKLLAVARAKDLTRQETQTDVDRFKERLKQEHQKEVGKLRETVKAHEEELQELQAEKLQRVYHERESSALLNRTERTVINEINEECRRTANLLGITPRKVEFPSFCRTRDGISSPQVSKNRPLTTTALANLRACNEELRNHVQELKQELETQKVAMAKASKEKEEGMKNFKKRLEREKVEAIAKFRTDLVKSTTPMSSNPHNFNYSPYEEEKSLNQTFETSMGHTKYPQQDELEHLEHEIRKVAMNQNKIVQANPSREQDDIASIKMMNKLQDKVRQLHSENNALRHAKLSVSVPDLSNPVHFRKQFFRKPTRDQERMSDHQRLNVAEMDSETASKQQQRNRSTMSQKMSNMTNLQTTLSNQTQDLLQLERAYSHLNNHHSRPHMSAW